MQESIRDGLAFLRGLGGGKERSKGLYQVDTRLKLSWSRQARLLGGEVDDGADEVVRRHGQVEFLRHHLWGSAAELLPV